jgi:folate-binding protein YgfZ
MPNHSAQKEYEALRDGRSIVLLRDWSSFTISGADRQKFLNSFCTNDVKRLMPGDSCEAFITSVKGRILGHGLVSCREQDHVFVGTPNQSPRLIEHLDRYIIREDVQLQDTTAHRTYFLASASMATLQVLANAGVWLQWNLLGAMDSAILETNANMPDEMLQMAGLKAAAGEEAFHMARIEAGTPLFGIDFDEQNFPQEVGRDRVAISFTKGCYLGQETVARIDALGHVNQQIVGVRFSGPDVPDPGTQLMKDGAVVGKITSATFSPKLKSAIGLAMVRREANAIGPQLTSAFGDCRVVALHA